MYKYEHGGDIYTRLDRKLVDFSANINPLGIPAGIKQAIKHAVKDCVNYPDPFCRELGQATAKFLGVSQTHLYFGNGAADVLFRLALAERPRQALLLAPTFADYEKALRSVDCNINYYELQEEQDFQIGEDILARITPAMDMVIICNPNNPTGQVTDQALMERLVERCQQQGVRLVVDECFMDFVALEKRYSLRKLLGGNHRLVILKAFTKTFAIPGVRLGLCMTADSKLLERLHEIGQDWNVSVIAQAAGIAAVQELDYLHDSMAYVSQERAYLKKALRSLGAKVYGSEANYVFFYLKTPHNLPKILEEQGYLIRSCKNYHNLGEGYYRVAVKTKAMNRSLIRKIREARKNAFFTNTD